MSNNKCVHCLWPTSIQCTPPKVKPDCLNLETHRHQKQPLVHPRVCLKQPLQPSPQSCQWLMMLRTPHLMKTRLYVFVYICLCLFMYKHIHSLYVKCFLRRICIYRSIYFKDILQYKQMYF